MSKPIPPKTVTVYSIKLWSGLNLTIYHTIPTFIDPSKEAF